MCYICIWTCKLRLSYLLQVTPKEAFRMLSHKFHGKGPGKMKQEKRMKQYQEELKLKQMKNSDTPSLSVERMREAQAQLKTPYLVLSGHVKPGYVLSFLGLIHDPACWV